MSHQCTLEQILTIVDDHLDELREWNGGGLRFQLENLQRTLDECPEGRQTPEWLDVRGSRNVTFMRFLLSTDLTRTSSVYEVAQEVEKILTANDSHSKGAGYGQVGRDVELNGQVVNSTLIRIRQQIQALTAALAAEQKTQPTVAAKVQSTTTPETS